MYSLGRCSGSKPTKGGNQPTGNDQLWGCRNALEFAAREGTPGRVAPLDVQQLPVAWVQPSSEDSGFPYNVLRTPASIRSVIRGPPTTITIR